MIFFFLLLFEILARARSKEREFSGEIRVGWLPSLKIVFRVSHPNTKSHFVPNHMRKKKEKNTRAYVRERGEIRDGERCLVE